MAAFLKHIWSRIWWSRNGTFLCSEKILCRNISNFKTRKGLTQRKEQTDNVFIPLARRTKKKPHEVNEDVEWSSVYQVARPFDPYVIPLALRMGRPGPGEVPPPAEGNIELLKIPNFFHLTPPAIEKHCKALKELCTPWPSKLPSLPLKITTTNRVSPSCDISYDESRIVELKFKVKDLSLPPRCQDKLIALVGPERFNKKTDTITIVGDRCPTRKQNKEHVIYLMKVLYYEATKYEAWEERKDDDPTTAKKEEK